MGEVIQGPEGATKRIFPPSEGEGVGSPSFTHKRQCFIQHDDQMRECVSAGIFFVHLCFTYDAISFRKPCCFTIGTIQLREIEMVPLCQLFIASVLWMSAIQGGRH